jgi:hypothetical protein
MGCPPVIYPLESTGSRMRLALLAHEVNQLLHIYYNGQQWSSINFGAHKPMVNSSFTSKVGHSPSYPFKHCTYIKKDRLIKITDSFVLH